MKRIKSTAMTAAFALCAALLIYESKTAAGGVSAALSVCAEVVIPSLFPFMAFSGAIIASGGFCGGRLSRAAGRLFHLPAAAMPAVLLSLVGGYPVGASLTARLLESGCITREQAKRMVLFCFNAGPAFVISAVGVSMLGSRRAGVLLLVSLCFSTAATGILLGFLPKASAQPPTGTNAVSAALTPAQALTSGVTGAGRGIFNVCVWIVLFGALISAVSSLAADRLPEGVGNFIVCLLEVTQGLRLSVKGLPLPLTAALLSFGGVCVHCQVLSVGARCGVGVGFLLLARAFSAVAALGLMRLLLVFFPVASQTLSNISVNSVRAFSSNAPAAAALMVLCAILILDLDTKEKVW